MKKQHHLIFPIPSRPLSVSGGVAVLLVLLLMVLSGWLAAQPVADNSLETLLSQADQAASSDRWEKARDYYETALKVATLTQQETIREKIVLCSAHIALNKRYADGSVARHIEQMSYEQGCETLKQIWNMIFEHYYMTINQHKLFSGALLELVVGLEKEDIRRQYQADTRALEPLLNQLKAMRQQIQSNKDIHFDLLYYQMTGLNDLSERAGLGSSWPVAELAYALADGLDKYCYVLSPSQYDALYEQLTGVYAGIGVELVFGEDYPLVFDVVAGSPAAGGGIQPGDTMIKVGNVDIKNKSTESVRQLLAGPKDSLIMLTINRPADDPNGVLSQEITVKRGVVSDATVREAAIFGAAVGYFRVSSFDFDTAWQMRSAVEALKKEGAKGLIIDLRNNGGGVLEAAVNAVRLFLDEGIIVTVKSQAERVVYRAGGDNFHCFDLPVILLVNDNTASAAELFAAALRDHQRAILMGEKTFGKAVVQSIYQIKPAEMGLCLTTATYIPPGQEEFNLRGLAPDISVKNNAEKGSRASSARQLYSTRNEVIQAAMNYMKEHHALQ